MNAQKRKKDLLSLFFRYSGSLIIIGIIAIMTLYFGPRSFGYDPYVIVSASMEPALRIGDVVYVKEYDPNLFEEGDIACFYPDERSDSPTAHRVVNNDRTNHHLLMIGDANESEDIRMIPYINVSGKVTFHLPLLGHLMKPLNTIVGKLILIIVFLSGAILLELGRKMP